MCGFACQEVRDDHLVLRRHLVGLTLLATLLIPFGATARAADSSPAGRWERVPFAATGFEPGADVRSIVPFHGQLFAAGWVTTFQRDNPNALWRSSDGHRWERIEPTPFGATTVEQLVATPAGLLTFGQASSHDGRGPTSIWRSTDGLSWQLVTSSAPWGFRMIVAAPAGLVAAGVDDASGCGSPPLSCTSTAIWSSRDGSTWTKAEGGASVFPRGSVVGVVRAGRGLVAVGFRQDGVTKHTTATIVWTSPDGATWRRRPARELGTLGAFPGLLAARAAVSSWSGKLGRANRRRRRPRRRPRPSAPRTERPRPGSASSARA